MKVRKGLVLISCVPAVWFVQVFDPPVDEKLAIICNVSLEVELKAIFIVKVYVVPIVTGAFNVATAVPLLAMTTFPVHPLLVYEEQFPNPAVFETHEPVTLEAGIVFNKF